MNENEINKKMRKVYNYLGTYALDELQNLRIRLFPSFLIINLDLRKNSGTHWIGLALYHNDIYVCDSLGTILSTFRFPTELVNFLHLISFKKQLHITNQLQSLSSTNCGKFCTVFIYKMSISNNYLSFLSYFCKDVDLNDCIINLLEKSCFNKK